MDCALARLSAFMKPDPHAEGGRYAIRSLYFDDPSGSAFEEKESGVKSRHKFRIRIYNGLDDYIVLENKIKEGNYVRKDSARLSRDEYGEIMSGRCDFLAKRGEAVAKDFLLDRKVNMLRPEVIVDYDRVPLVYAPGQVRVTFDMNVRSAFADLDIFADPPSYQVFGQDMLIMEVKYTQFIPDVIRAVLPQEACRMASSKYVLCDTIKRRIRGGYDK